MNILIIGGAGFIGSHLAEHFISRHNVTVLDDLSTGKHQSVSCDAISYLSNLKEMVSYEEYYMAIREVE